MCTNCHSYPLYTCKLQGTWDWLHHVASGNPTALHYPLCVPNLPGWQWFPDISGVYGSEHKLKVGFWCLDLAAGSSDKGACNLHFWAAWGDPWRGPCQRLWDSTLEIRQVRQEFLNLQGLRTGSTIQTWQVRWVFSKQKGLEGGKRMTQGTKRTDIKMVGWMWEEVKAWESLCMSQSLLGRAHFNRLKSKSTQKYYTAVFVCMGTKAVHL